MSDVRIETDSLGEVRVPADKLWGAQTQRSLEHFSIGKDLIPREMITAYAILKKAAAIANRDGKRLDNQRYGLIVQTCDEILADQHHDMFPLHVWMTGSGTQFNMNINEVIGHLAGAHPNDDVNRGMSSNDAIPAAIHIAAAQCVLDSLLPAMRGLQSGLAGKAREFHEVIKTGRTHLQDAVPMRLGQEFNGYARQVELAVLRMEAALDGIYELPLGGTAVGTGLNAPEGFAAVEDEFRACLASIRLTGESL